MLCYSAALLPTGASLVLAALALRTALLPRRGIESVLQPAAHEKLAKETENLALAAATMDLRVRVSRVAR